MSRAQVIETWHALLAEANLEPRPRLALGIAADFPAARDHAFTDGRTVWIAPRMLEAPLARVVGVLAHELGHVLALQRGFDEHTERDADRLAELMFGFRVCYDDLAVQNCARGVSPRPARLG